MLNTNSGTYLTAKGWHFPLQSDVTTMPTASRQSWKNTTTQRATPCLPTTHVSVGMWFPPVAVTELTGISTPLEPSLATTTVLT